MFPGDGLLKPSETSAKFLYPDSVERVIFTEDYEYGGIALNDPSQGLLVQVWKAWTTGTHILVAPVTNLSSPTTIISTATNVTEVSLSFDQNMRPTIAYVDNGSVKLFWFDSSVPGMVTTTYADAYNPLVSMDDKRSFASSTNDIILGYLKNNACYYRIQRDRFGIEYKAADLDSDGNSHLVGIGLSTQNRFQFFIRNSKVI